MGLDFKNNKAQSPIDKEEKEGLKIRTISTRKELDEFEQANIEKAVEWTLKRRIPMERILSLDFIREVHRQMFSDLWEWAGVFRKTNKNIGVDKYLIEQHIKVLIDDCGYWINNETYGSDEIAIRFKHRLVSIYPFPNGNGRHSRLFADILISHGFGEPVFTWGGKGLTGQNMTRSKYLEAIHLADQGDIKPLVTFARS